LTSIINIPQSSDIRYPFVVLSRGPAIRGALRMLA
jgi:hypothetical protein